ncbi:MAG: helix-turn-helix domain-containing protein [Thermoplasmata archaeon]
MRDPTELAQLTQLPKSNVSRALSALASQGVVYCQTPDLRKGRLYALTPESALQLQVRNRTDELPSKGPVPDVRSGFAPRVRGEAMTAGVVATAEILGAQALTDLCRACGFNLLGFERDGWYSMDLHHLFLRELTGMAEENGFDLLRRMGRKSVAHLPYMQRFLTDRKVNLIALAERTRLAHDHYFNFGRFEVLPSVEGVEIRQYDMLPTPEFCAARSGNFEGILEAKGVRREPGRARPPGALPRGGERLRDGGGGSLRFQREGVGPPRAELAQGDLIPAPRRSSAVPGEPKS